MLLQTTKGTVANLAHAFALQLQVLSYLGHRLALAVQAEETVDDLRLTVAQR